MLLQEYFGCGTPFAALGHNVGDDILPVFLVEGALQDELASCAHILPTPFLFTSVMFQDVILPLLCDDIKRFRAFVATCDQTSQQFHMLLNFFCQRHGFVIAGAKMAVD